MKTAKEKSKNLATPGKPMTQDQFSALIKEAENGEFSPIEDSIKRMEEWRLRRKK
jgi:hypothetical protein